MCLPDDHPFARASSAGTALRLDQLRDQDWIAILPGEPAREQFDAAAEAVDLRARIVFETENDNVAHSLVGTGIAMALLSRLTIAPTAGATHRRLVGPGLHRTLYAVTARDTTARH